MLQSQGLVVVRGDAVAIILYFNRLESLVLESYVCVDRVRTTLFCRCLAIPMLVPPASRLFSTNSFATEHKSTMTWPDWI
jgi:hypothetical protein